MEQKRSGGKGGPPRPGRGAERDAAERVPGGEAVLAAQAREHRPARGRLPEDAQHVPGDGVRARRQSQSSAQRPQDPARRPGRLGDTDSTGHGLSAQQGADQSYTQGSQELER